jgi:hypothetical protein
MSCFPDIERAIMPRALKFSHLVKTASLVALQARLVETDTITVAL